MLGIRNLPALVASLVRRLTARLGLRKRMRGSRGVGQDWEDLAAKHLEREGYRIVGRNFRCRVGEIDFVARDGPILCFVEVKGRRSVRFGRPEEAVNAEKRRRILRAAEIYLRRYATEPEPVRFDIVAIVASREMEHIDLFRGAFEGPAAPRRRT